MSPGAPGGRSGPAPQVKPPPERLDANLNIVFVLGAGFSRPLGGLLLNELLAFTSVGVLNKLFPVRAGSVHPFEGMREARVVYQWGKERKMWVDPEEYLETLETAHRQAPDAAVRAASHSQVESLVGQAIRWDPPGGGRTEDFRVRDIERLVVGTRQALALDCALFLRAVQPAKLERWKPYLEWAQGLNKKHTIISFNYDAVLDLLAEQKDARLRPVYPALVDGDDMAEQIRNAGSANRAVVLNLHGSTRLLQLREPGEASGPEYEPDFEKAILRADAEFLLGIPGPGKAQLGCEEGPLARHWEHARNALTNADRVVFIGYRFPESDADARVTLLDSLRRNSSTDLRVYTVLGQNSRDGDRLGYLFGSVLGDSARIEQVPLSGQEYFDVVWKEPRRRTGTAEIVRNV